jgi:hypothetical protein
LNIPPAFAHVLITLLNWADHRFLLDEYSIETYGGPPSAAELESIASSSGSRT